MQADGRRQRGREAGCHGAGERDGAGGRCTAPPCVVVAAEQERAGRGRGSGDGTDDGPGGGAYLVFALRPGPARYGSDSLLKHSPSRPADVHVSQSRAVAGSVVKEHSVNGAFSGVSANSVSRAVRRRA
jgi:hypothetical protein